MWNIEAYANKRCYDKHGAIDDVQTDLSQTSAEGYVSEIISASQKARKKLDEAVNTLPPYLRAPLGIVIGAVGFFAETIVNREVASLARSNIITQRQPS